MCCGIELAVSGDHEDVAVLVGGGTGVALPDGAVGSIGRSVENRFLLESVRFIGHQPTVVRADVARRTPREIDRVLRKKQSGARIFVERIEVDAAAGLTGAFACDRSLDFDRAAELFRAGGYRERVQPLFEIVGLKNAFAFLGSRENVKSSGLEVDDRSGSDSNLRGDEETAGIAFRERGNTFAGIGETHVPERSGGSSVGVEGVYAVVFGGDKENVVFAFAGDFDVGKIKRLGVNVTVNFESEEFAELAGIDIGVSENFFVEIGAGTRVVVLGGGDLRAEERGREKRESKKQVRSE